MEDPVVLGKPDSIRLCTNGADLAVWGLFLVSFGSILLRIMSRIGQQASCSSDERILCLAKLLFFVYALILSVPFLKRLILQDQMMEHPELSEDRAQFTYILQMLFILDLWAGKLSLLLLYERVLHGVSTRQIVQYFTIATMVSAFLAFVPAAVPIMCSQTMDVGVTQLNVNVGQIHCTIIKHLIGVSDLISTVLIGSFPWYVLWSSSSRDDSSRLLLVSLATAVVGFLVGLMRYVLWLRVSKMSALWYWQSVELAILMTAQCVMVMQPLYCPRSRAGLQGLRRSVFRMELEELEPDVAPRLKSWERAKDGSEGRALAFSLSTDDLCYVSPLVQDDIKPCDGSRRLSLH